MSVEGCGDGDCFDDSVDPRVQVELECLNAATNEINRLEVDLDEAKIQFRSILNESSAKIELCWKQLEDFINCSLPYYEARLQAKVALRETEKLTAAFEKANSAHAAAKEMVFLAEEGLQTEGCTFDHAWQEMLNHATMRVNEEESTRTECEARLKNSAMLYEQAVEKVQLLEKSLKKSINKSRPYFGLRVHYSQLLEQQKDKVKTLEKKVAQTKLKYADTLNNLERISNEIHQSRKGRNTAKKWMKSGESSEKDSSCWTDVGGVGGKAITKQASDDRREKATPTSSSSMQDTDCWSEWSDLTPSNSMHPDTRDLRENDARAEQACEHDWLTEPSHKPCVSEVARADEQISDNDSSLSHCDSDTLSHSRKSDVEDGDIVMCAILDVRSSPSNIMNQQTDSNKQYGLLASCFPQQSTQHSQWTEIKLSSSGEEDFLKMESNAFTNSHEDLDIPYAPLTELETEYSKENVCEESTQSERSKENKEMESPTCDSPATDKSLLTWLTNNKKQGEKLPTTPSKMSNLRRQSLDVLWNNATGEKMKEIISQGILKLNMSTANESRNSESLNTIEQLVDEETNDGGCQNDSNPTRQFGLQFFSKKSRVDEDGGGGGMAAGVRGRKRHVSPSPLERTLSFLNSEDEHPNLSLSSLDMLSEEQLSALILDVNLTEQYRDVA